MRTFEFRRHSIKDGPRGQALGPRGYALARAVGERQLRGRGFTHFFCSDRWRTLQTLAAFDEGAGDMAVVRAPPSAPIYPEHDRADVRALFRACRDAELRGERILDTALMTQPDLCHELGIAMKTAFLDWNAVLPADAAILVVGHSPSLELMAAAFALPVASLRECQGYRIAVEDVGPRQWRIVKDHRSPDLDPAAIRAELKLDPDA